MTQLTQEQQTQAERFIKFLKVNGIDQMPDSIRAQAKYTPIAGFSPDAYMNFSGDGGWSYTISINNQLSSRVEDFDLVALMELYGISPPIPKIRWDMWIDAKVPTQGSSTPIPPPPPLSPIGAPVPGRPGYYANMWGDAASSDGPSKGMVPLVGLGAVWVEAGTRFQYVADGMFGRAWRELT